jgi:hypothetical protein
MNGYGILFVPESWAFGRWQVNAYHTGPKKKTLWALGPFRFVIHYGLGSWKGVT